ncbi:MAG: hypothetical protein ACRELY_08200, partial [Polyangiaceae bacterium]
MARRSYRSLVLSTIAVLTLGIVLGFVARKIALARRPPIETAKLSLAVGNDSDAEKTLWHLLQTEPPTMERFFLFLDAHEQAPASVTEPQIDAFLARSDLPDDFVHLARFTRELRNGTVDPDLTHWVVAAADRDPPVPWANRLLADRAAQDADPTSMAERLMREGRFVPAHRSDIVAALLIYQEDENWAAIGDAMQDPRVASEASPPLKARIAAETNDWKSAVKWSFFTTYARPPLGPL